MLNKNNTMWSISLPIEQNLDTTMMTPLKDTSLIFDLSEADIAAGRSFVLVDNVNSPTRYVPYTRCILTIFKKWRKLKYVYESVLNTVDDAITIVDPNGIVLDWNKKSEEVFHTKAKDIINKPITRFFKEEAVMLMSAIHEGKERIGQYNQPREGVHVLINTRPIYMGTELIGGISIEREVTDVVKLHNELSTTSAYAYNLESLIEKKRDKDPFHKIKGRSIALAQAIEYAKKVALTDAPAIIIGESGVGKRLFAQAIHKTSARVDEPFVDLNCGAIPDALFASELCGYEENAFVGHKTEGKQGKIATAKAGTLFLDDIAKLSLDSQVKLLHILQEKKYYRVGGTEPIPFDVRIICATNKPLKQSVEEGKFNEELYYLLNVVSLHVPPLRERVEDIAELVQLFIHEFSIKYKKPITTIDHEVMLAFMHFPWSGNMRQLKNTVERMVILADEDELSSRHLPEELTLTSHYVTGSELPIESSPLEDIPDEKSRIIAALQKTYGNKTAAAKLLNISRVTLYNKLKKYQLS